LQTIANSSASAHLIDVTRTVSRAGQRPTGVDRIERAYIAHLCACETPLFGLVRTKLGYLLLDKDGCTRLLAHCDAPVWHSADVLSRLTRRAQPERAVTESGLREIAIDRATPRRLRHLLQRRLPKGSVYFNIGQTNLNDRMIFALRACDGMRIAVYLHDTIPMDYPDTQTSASRLKFKRFFQRLDQHADFVICNSTYTKERCLLHATHLKPSAVHVVFPGIPDMCVGTAPVGPWSGKPYFVVIGTLEPRKNIGFLLDLWEEMGPDAPPLVLCGRRGWLNEDVFARLDRGIAHVHELNDLDDAGMWGLLKDSCGLLFPSIVEGFGYPAIEAARLNVPLICNPLPPFLEVLGDYPIYADESDRYVWRNNIEQLAQRRRGQSGEQNVTGGFEPPTWQVHFNRLFTLL
jgi:glycosyltransferase involved in cell wall biosynthesis